VTLDALLRRPIQAMMPFSYISKEIERRAQEGEGVTVLEKSGPIRYQAGQTAKTRAADPRLILKGKRFPIWRIMRASGVSQHTLERFLDGQRVYPRTRQKIAQAIQGLERNS
jgi:hypothetical protein